MVRFMNEPFMTGSSGTGANVEQNCYQNYNKELYDCQLRIISEDSLHKHVK